MNSGVFKGGGGAMPPFGRPWKFFYRRLYMKRCVFCRFPANFRKNGRICGFYWTFESKKCFSFRGPSPPWPPDQGLCPWTPLGASLPDLRYRPIPKIFQSAQPLRLFSVKLFEAGTLSLVSESYQTFLKELFCKLIDKNDHLPSIADWYQKKILRCFVVLLIYLCMISADSLLLFHSCFCFCFNADFRFINNF